MSLRPDLKADILTRVKKGLPRQIDWRRRFHMYPELSDEEYETTAFIKTQLSKLRIKTLPIKMRTGILAEIQGDSPGPTVAVRTDIDALPIQERTSLPFKSKIPGRMHACGHDMHMATILGTAALLNEMKNEIHGKVRFIFQPSEEVPPGGARPMIKAGALKNVSMIFGLHVDPRLATGKIGLRDGPTMASVTDFDLIVNGKSGHAARPHLTVDAIATAAEVIESIQKIVSREIDPIQPVAITFGKINGGVARNVICDRVEITGTARALAPQAARLLPKLIRRTADSVCRARGAKLEIKVIADYPVLVNHPDANQIYRQNAEMLFGKRSVAETSPGLGGEDFACYLEKVKGAMFRLGIMNKKIKADKPWHSPEFIADEEALYYGTSVIVASVIDFLQGRS
ncbi:MAG TPA: amidohydrolase [candidate division Zixibacteria bacterium]|nr:amidohydrolase [candidate division Zixibacteria bacterium]